MVQISPKKVRCGVLKEACDVGNPFVGLTHYIANVAHELSSYPLAYSLVVIPLSVARWLLFSHKGVPSAATFFGIIMFNLSGAINALLFLIVRPHLLLFTPLEGLGEPKVEDENSTTSSAILSDEVKCDHSPQPTWAGPMDDV